jgi:hypothetical protein
MLNSLDSFCKYLFDFLDLGTSCFVVFFVFSYYLC